MKARELTESIEGFRGWMSEIIKVVNGLAISKNIEIEMEDKIKKFGLPQIGFESLYSEGFSPEDVGKEVFTLLKNKRITDKSFYSS